jgi:purine catabolism regulator
VVREPASDVLDVLAGLSGGVSEAVSATGIAAALEAAESAALRSRGALVPARQEPDSVQDLLSQVMPAFADVTLAGLRKAPGGPVLEDTLRTWLSLHGQTVATAEVLGVHRHTVRERLRRSAVLLGRDLDDPQVRAELWLALAT